jgi:hypothetical protein
MSAGMVSAALALLARPGVDVPAAALVLATAALIAPLSRAPVVDPAPAAPAREGRPEQTAAETDP